MKTLVLDQKAPTSASHRIRERRDPIIEHWLTQIRESIPAARYEDDVKLRNGLSEFLEAIATYLTSTPGTPGGEHFSSEIIAICKQHGHQRAVSTGFTLDQVIIEYRLLREVILEVLNEPISPPSKDINKILGAIDYGISEAAIAFSQIKGFDKRQLYQEAKKDAVQQKIEKDYAQEEVKNIREERDAYSSLVVDLKRERELREHFIATLSHDLNNPLTAVRSFAEIMIRFSESSKMHPDLAHQIIGIIDRADRMVTDLLDTSRIQAGERLPLTIEEVDFQNLVIQTLNELSIVYGEGRFITSLNTKVRGFWSCDGLRRVIENLVTNAVKYGDPTTAILISIWKDNEQAHLSVHNKGKAIPPEDLSAVFKPFLRTQVGQSSGKPGWGLGLTLVRGIMDAHGGSVTVESLPEKGTTFQINLPLDSRPFQVN